MSAKKRFLLRLDETLYDLLEKWAADELRSVNSQIEFLLVEAVRRSGRLKRKREKEAGVSGEAEGLAGDE